jgi:hypothetical protein
MKCENIGLSVKTIVINALESRAPTAKARQTVHTLSVLNKHQLSKEQLRAMLFNICRRKYRKLSIGSNKYL